MTDLMVDIETLGTTPGSVITEIGVASFGLDGDGVDNSSKIAIQIHDAQSYGLTIDWETVEWWHRQKPNNIFDSLKTPRKSLKEALLWLSYRVRMEQPQRIWAKSPQFDLVLLEHAYRACGLAVPWSYKQPRDVRTLLEAAGKPHIHTPEGFVAHDPEWDCQLQVLEVQTAHSILKGNR